MQNLILGIQARKKHGKTTVADYLVRKHGFQELAFAEEVKAVGRRLFRLGHEQLYGDQKEVVDPRYNKTPREILQHIGQSMREIWDEVWISLELERMKPGVNYVVSDVRYVNEARTLLRRGGHVLHIHRVGADTGKFEDHPSETEVDKAPFDYWITNDGSIDDLYRGVEDVLQDIRARTS